MKHTARRAVIASLVSVVLAALLYWFWLPPIHPRCPDFWTFILACLVIVLVVFSLAGLTGAKRKGAGKKEDTVVDFGGTKVHLPSMPNLPGMKKWAKGLLWCGGGIVALMILASVIGATLFNAGRYKDLIVRTEGSFTEDIPKQMNRIPVVDRASATQLGKRTLGQMADLVSQFEIAPDYTQINFGGGPVRVTPLVYADLFKWFANQKNGIPGYIQVDMVSQEAELVRLEQGIRYSPSEYLLRDLERHIRFQFPTKIFDSSSFEIDDEGMPYWITPTMTYRIGIWSGLDVEGAILTNAVTGESRYYKVEDVPTWVDVLYRADLILEQLGYNGRFQSGFWNSYFGQKGVLRTTDGYNYIAEGDDVYLYTGVTSVGGDESNVGFLLSNQRTKETKYYPCAGATEYSAMDSAEGQVQNLRYTATFPLLLNVAEQPTYFMALKDASELVKMYAMVNVNQYQIVATGATVAECESNYRQMLRQSNLISDDQTGIDQPVETDRRSLEGVIAEIRSAVVDGNSIYFLRFTGETDFTVRMSAADVPYAPLLNVGDRVRVWYYDGHVSEFWIEACDLELLPVSTPAEPDDAQPSGGVDA